MTPVVTGPFRLKRNASNLLDWVPTVLSCLQHSALECGTPARTPPLLADFISDIAIGTGNSITWQGTSLGYPSINRFMARTLSSLRFGRVWRLVSEDFDNSWPVFSMIHLFSHASYFNNSHSFKMTAFRNLRSLSIFPADFLHEALFYSWDLDKCYLILVVIISRVALDSTAFYAQISQHIVRCLLGHFALREIGSIVLFSTTKQSQSLRHRFDKT